MDDSRNSFFLLLKEAVLFLSKYRYKGQEMPNRSPMRRFADATVLRGDKILAINKLQYLNLSFNIILLLTYISK